MRSICCFATVAHAAIGSTTIEDIERMLADRRAKELEKVPF